MSKVRRCDRRCHEAKKPRCRCWCGGRFHGANGAKNREAPALLEVIRHLRQEGQYPEGTYRYVKEGG